MFRTTVLRLRLPLATFVFILSMTLSSDSWAQEAEKAEEQVAATPDQQSLEDSLKDLDDNVPRGSVYRFFEMAKDGDYEEAAKLLNTKGTPRNIRDIAPESLARQLHAVLDRALWIDFASLSDEEAGHEKDGLSRQRDLVGNIRAHEGKVPVLVEQAAWKNGKPVWKIAAQTVAQIPTLYDEFGYGPLADYLPAPFFEFRFLDIQLWQWIGLIALITFALLIASIIVWILNRLIHPLAERSETHWDDQFVSLAGKPIRILIAIGIFGPLSYLLRLALPVQVYVWAIQKTLLAIGIVWLIIRLVDVISGITEEYLAARGQQVARSVIPLGRRTVKAILFLIAVLAILQNFGINVTSLIAGLGIGGLAFALAAQKTIENLFGGLTLIADRPVQVGDFCRFGDKLGTVEEVGLRSTRVRTLDRTVISVANSEFSNLQLENFGRRDRIRFVTTLGLRYETTPDQLRYVLVELRKLLLAHPKVHGDPARVRLVGFGASSLDLEVYCYLITRDWDEFLAIREDLLLRMMEIVEDAGSGFAFPSQTIYTEKDGGLDTAKTESAIARVSAWRGEQSWPFPNIPDTEARKIANTLEYPPKGSSRGVSSREAAKGAPE